GRCPGRMGRASGVRVGVAYVGRRQPSCPFRPEGETMDRTLSRRRFLGASASAAAVTFLGGGGTRAFGRSSGGGHPTVLPHLLGVQHFSVRDATARLSIA